MSPLLRAAIAAGAFVAASLPLAALAQTAGGTGFSFDLGLGVQAAPSYVGSDETEAQPWVILRNFSLGQASPGRPADGFHISPSFNYIGARDADDDDRLEGLDEIDRAGELGVRLGYRFAGADAYATIRKGFGGHDGVVGNIGLRYTQPVSPRLSVTGGLEADYADAEYMGTYFGVTPEESLASGYPVHDPEGGLKSATATLELRYQATEATAVLGRVQAERLMGDAADSPIVRDKDQLSVGIGVVRSLNFRF